MRVVYLLIWCFMCLYVVFMGLHRVFSWTSTFSDGLYELYELVGLYGFVWVVLCFFVVGLHGSVFVYVGLYVFFNL